MSTDPYPVVIAIDFGTTFSGCSYAVKHEENVYDVVGWPKYQGFYGKVPTLLYYKNARLVDWGYGAHLVSLKPKQQGKLMKRFKMWLMDQEADPTTVQTTIADYLEHLHSHVLATLARQLKSYHPDHFCYCITVPAIWSDQAKGHMRQACVQAGILRPEDPLERLSLISEPEAAALYCQQLADQHLHHGDCVMMIDAGGGTLDLSLYHVSHTTSAPILEEAIAGTGGACGSSDIDENLRIYLLSVLGPQAKDMPSCTMEDILTKFVEYIKPEFDPQGPTIQLDIPSAALAYIQDGLLSEDGCLPLDPLILAEQVFDPVVNKVTQLIQLQLDGLPRTVDLAFLVGGFGSSSYLYQAIHHRFVPANIKALMVPPRPDMAIARGAVYHILQPKRIHSKVLRVTYGLRTRLPFQQGIDAEDRAIVTSDGIKRCATRFDIIASKGQVFQVGEKISRSFWVRYPKHTEADIYVYDGEAPWPRYIDDTGVTKLVDFPIRMPMIEGAAHGDPIDITIDFVFGHSELQIDVYVHGKHIQLTTLYR
ncbi:hypothetical protein DM01DRAFT_1385572 [Hesseltinella vesiculosa]|uniref:Actin-like ATPase domain-containing protein n=1 Tax=Hesseltinella vesiculosa TaxID=101127 RepID=A0A1X2G956_9FUNG|nr:hypothetical protein DM01DRAFT_1385572 [Hesseltinella vesiculosa]